MWLKKKLRKDGEKKMRERKMREIERVSKNVIVNSDVHILLITFLKIHITNYPFFMIRLILDM